MNFQELHVCVLDSARQRSVLAGWIVPRRLVGMPHEEIRMCLGLTVGEYRDAKRWLMDAVADATVSGVSVHEALIAREARQAGLVLRFALLKEAGWTGERIRENLELSFDGYWLADEWRRDALNAAGRQRLTNPIPPGGRMRSPVIVFDHVTKIAGAIGVDPETDAKLTEVLGSGTKPSFVSGATPPQPDGRGA